MEPSEPPPAYEDATASNSKSKPTHLDPSSASNGVSSAMRRSMEDESRNLPTGWLRQYDAKEHHQFFVDTNQNPPRSIWHHPYDDDEYLSSVSPSERARIHELQAAPPPSRTAADAGAPSDDDINDEEEHHSHASHPDLPPRPEKKNLGRKLKDRLTHSTHEEREARRRERDEQDRRIAEQHQRLRAAMARAAETGEPQLFGKDKQGKDVYIEPPYGPGQSYGGYGQGAYGVDPYANGPYSAPNARFIRPQYPYARPYGYGGGYGGGGSGYRGGLGAGAPLLGLGGGLLLGSLLF